jgi:hypothetical protein
MIEVYMKIYRNLTKVFNRFSLVFESDNMTSLINVPESI